VVPNSSKIRRRSEELERIRARLTRSDREELQRVSVQAELDRGMTAERLRHEDWTGHTVTACLSRPQNSTKGRPPATERPFMKAIHTWSVHRTRAKNGCVEDVAGDAPSLHEGPHDHDDMPVGAPAARTCPQRGAMQIPRLPTLRRLLTRAINLGGVGAIRWDAVEARMALVLAQGQARHWYCAANPVAIGASDDGTLAEVRLSTVEIRLPT